MSNSIFKNFVSPKILIGLALAVFLGGYFVFFYQRQNGDDTISPQACTKEARSCPDGSAVGRTGPNCEFAPCPGEIDTSDWKIYRNEEYGFEVRYPAILKTEMKSSESGIESIRFIESDGRLRVAVRIYPFYPDEYDLSSFANRFITLGESTDTIVGGLSAKKFSPDAVSPEYFTVIFVNGRIGFQFDGAVQDQDATADKMLTTLKFFR